MDAGTTKAPIEKRDWLSWLRRRPAEIAPPTPTPPPEPAVNVDIWDFVAAGWLNGEKNEIAPGFPLSREDVVIDVGCGEGFYAGFYGPRVAKSILVDQDVRAGALLERLRGEGADMEAITADAANLPVADSTASVVICTEVLEHVDDPAVVMRELARIGRPGARYLLTAPGTLSEKLQIGISHPSHFEKPNHIRIFEPGELARTARDAGLVVEREVHHGFYFTLWWMFFWPTKIANFGEPHPLLDAWTRTWGELLKLEGGAAVKAKLDALAPKVSVVIARKPE